MAEEFERKSKQIETQKGETKARAEKRAEETGRLSEATKKEISEYLDKHDEDIEKALGRLKDDRAEDILKKEKLLALREQNAKAHEELKSPSVNMFYCRNLLLMIETPLGREEKDRKYIEMAKGGAESSVFQEELEHLERKRGEWLEETFGIIVPARMKLKKERKENRNF